jgi:hypothetical protein
VPLTQIVCDPPADAVGVAFTITEKVAEAVAGEQEFELVTVIVSVTVVPASPAAAVYVGVKVVDPEVIDPEPSSVHSMVPLVALAPLTVADPFSQMVILPPALASGREWMVIVADPSVKPPVLVSASESVTD